MDIGQLAWPGGDHWVSMLLDSTCLPQILDCYGLQIQIWEGLTTDLRDELAQTTDRNSQAYLIDFCTQLESKNHRLSGHIFLLTRPGWAWFVLNGLLRLFGEKGICFLLLSLGGSIDCFTVAHISFFSWKCHSLLVMKDAGFAHQSCHQLLVRMGNSGPRWAHCGTDMGMLLTPALFHLLFCPRVSQSFSRFHLWGTHNLI